MGKILTIRFAKKNEHVLRNLENFIKKREIKNRNQFLIKIIELYLFETDGKKFKTDMFLSDLAEILKKNLHK